MSSKYTFTKYTIHSQSDWVQNALCGVAVDAFFLEYNSPWSQTSSLEIQRWVVDDAHFLLHGSECPFPGIV